MVANSTDKTNSRSGASNRSAKPDSKTAVATNGKTSDEDVTPDITDSTKEETMSADVIDVTPEAEHKGAIQLHQQPSLSVWNRPVMSSDIEIVGTIQDGGIRPIGASHLDIVGTMLTNRPITASHLQIFEMVGKRPVFCDEVKMIEGEGLYGRPVMPSDPDLMNDKMGYGQRPIASNNVDDAPALMGFID